MSEVTQEDREAAASVAVLAEMRELILSGRADHHAEPWAAHRQRGKLEGARLAIEAAKAKVKQCGAEHYAAGNDDGDMICSIIADDLAALSPAKIVGEG